MVTVTDYALRQKESGEEFFALIVQGGIELVPSKNGGVYATARTAGIPSTFDEKTCKALIGKQLEGDIKRIDCNPYEYTVPETGEVVSLDYTYRFVPEGMQQEERIPDLKVLG